MDDATLSGLTLEDAKGNAIALTPAFASTTNRYSATVENDIDQITVEPTTTDDGARVDYLNAKNRPITDEDAATDGLQTSLPVGKTKTINVKVTSEDGTVTETYTVAVTREALGLSALALSDDNGNPVKLTSKLTPASVNLYAFVPNAVDKITIDAEANNDAATVQLRDAADAAIADADTGTDGHQGGGRCR